MNFKATHKSSLFGEVMVTHRRGQLVYYRTKKDTGGALRTMDVRTFAFYYSPVSKEDQKYGLV